MNATLRRMAMATATCLMLGAAAFAQTATLEGDAKAADGSPIKGGLVKIVRQDIKGNYQVKTDKKGHYLHAGLPTGMYRIALEMDGKEVDVVDKVKLGLGDNPPVNFNLKAAAQQAQSIQKAVDSGQALTDDQTRGMSKEQKAALEKSMKDRQQQMAKNKALNEAFNKGIESIKAKDYDAAIESLNKAGEMAPDQDAVWTNLAEAYSGAAAMKKTPEEQMPLYEKSMEAYTKAMALRPTDADLHNNYGLVLAKAKKFDQALVELNKAAEMNPAAAGRYFYNLGALMTNAGQTDKAGEMFKKAIAADPNYADAQYQYGIFLISKAKMENGKLIPIEGTKEAFQKYLELKPDGPFAEPSKQMLTSMDVTIQTKYENPNAPKKAVKKVK